MLALETSCPVPALAVKCRLKSLSRKNCSELIDLNLPYALTGLHPAKFTGMRFARLNGMRCAYWALAQTSQRVFQGKYPLDSRAFALAIRCVQKKESVSVAAARGVGHGPAGCLRSDGSQERLPFLHSAQA